MLTNKRSGVKAARREMLLQQRAALRGEDRPTAAGRIVDRRSHPQGTQRLPNLRIISPVAFAHRTRIAREPS
jgi:hypothetical protein